jgi:L-lactate dehydrogenase complex protein LldG
MGHLAIAETGSVLLSEPSLEDRSVSMLTLAHATICPTAALVASLDDAAPVIRQRSLAQGGGFMTLVTGPSRTADIERVLTVGVQGPGKIMTIFVDDL